MKVAFITAGAAGMYCGSCMRDNTLVSALIARGQDAQLIPTYTPIRTDEQNVSRAHIFFGGINVFLEQKFWLFRHTPGFVDWLLNRPRLLRWVSRFAVNVDYADLGDLTVSMLRGQGGRQRKELRKLTHWLRTEVRPDVVLMTNALLSGIVPGIKKELDVPVLTTLQGDDIFLEALPADHRGRCLELIRENDRQMDGYISTSRSYAEHMSDYLGIDRAKIHVVYPGINLRGHGSGRLPKSSGGPPVIGYFARICPEKGFHLAVEAFIRLRARSASPPARFRFSGWLGEHNRAFLAEQLAKLDAAGLSGEHEHVDCPTHADKVAFLQSIDVMTVPTVYHEPKGLYVLEAWANGVPVVMPRHGSFPELIEATGGGVLVEPGDADGLAAALLELLSDDKRRADLGKSGYDAVRRLFTAEVMAAETMGVIGRYVPTPPVDPVPFTP